MFMLLYIVHWHGDGVVVLGVVVVVVVVVVVLVDGVLVVAVVLVTVLDGALLLLLLPLAETLMTVLLATAVLPLCGLVGSVVETVLGPCVLLLLINTVEIKVDVSGGPAVVNTDAVDADATQFLLTTYCVIVASSSYVFAGVRSLTFVWIQHGWKPLLWKSMATQVGRLMQKVLHMSSVWYSE
jgi:hypothetical protein